MRPSLTATTGRALLGEDADAVALGLRVDDVGGRALVVLEVGALDLVRVHGLRLHGEAALREAGERADEVGGQAADQPRAQEHHVDVPVGVVVGPDRAAQVLVGAGGLEVAGGGEDRVDRVVRVLQAVLVGVDAVGLPARGHELHPAQRAGGGDVEVAAVVRLDLVDRRQDLPADAVLDAGGLVDREEEGRDPELVDEEVGDADAGGARLGERDGRVLERRRAVGVAGRVVGVGRRRGSSSLDLLSRSSFLSSSLPSRTSPLSSAPPDDLARLRLASRRCCRCSRRRCRRRRCPSCRRCRCSPAWAWPSRTGAGVCVGVAVAVGVGVA